MKRQERAHQEAKGGINSFQDRSHPRRSSTFAEESPDPVWSVPGHACVTPVRPSP
jgi:hypothetical protein